MVAFKHGFQYCENEIQNFLNNQNVLFGEFNEDQDEILNDGPEVLDNLDEIFLKNFRIFFEIKDQKMKIYYLYPQLSFTVSRFVKHPRLVSTPLSE